LRAVRRDSRSPNFISSLYPSCDGQPFDLVPRRDRFRAIKRRFLDAFHRTNLAYARLRALRQQRRRARLADERAALQAVEQAICAREALEDRYASQGLVAVPLYLDGLAVNVQFQCPGSTAMQSMRVVSSCGQALAFALPVPVVRRRLK
jgi:hypothetical protein